MNRRHFLLSSAAVAAQATVGATAKALPPSSTESPDELLRRLSGDVLRPQFHVLPQAGGVGDPCAPRFYGGQYHVFFHGSYGGRGWAHAISPDLIHWKHLPIALSPTDGGYDSYGTFTGGVLSGGEEATVVYTGVTKVPRDQETIRAEGLRETQCIATSRDNDLRSWTKHAKPVIEGPPPGLKVTGFRDPIGWKDGDSWYIAIGSGFPQVGGAVLLYRSKDQEHWEYLHPLAQGVWNGQSFSNPVPSGEMWECPDFFALGNKHVLLYSTEGATWWEVGTYDKTELRFHSEKKGIIDHGTYYAPRSMEDGTGRRILWGWVQETRDPAAIKQAGWSGCLSLPRVLTLALDNALLMNVAPELSSLAQTKVEIKQPANSAEIAEKLAAAPIVDRRGEIRCSFLAGSAPCRLELQLGSNTDSAPVFIAAYSLANGAPFIAIGDKLIPVHPDHAGLATLHLWLDGSVVEAFIDSRQVATARCYLAPDKNEPTYVVWNGPATALKHLAVSEIKPISADRLTT